MSAEKSRPRCTGTGDAITNRKEKRMHVKDITPELQEAVDRFDDVFDFHYPHLRVPGTVGVVNEGCTVEDLDAATDLFIDSLPVSVIL